jgi:xanthine dehydrogenase accessory factor
MLIGYAQYSNLPELMNEVTSGTLASAMHHLSRKSPEPQMALPVSIDTLSSMQSAPTTAHLRIGASDIELFKSALDWFTAGRSVILVTVVATWGSSPRPVGSMLAISDDGQAIGSVSGGCIEDDISLDFMSGTLDISRPTLRHYGVEAEDAFKFGLPCGGTVSLVVEPLTVRSDLAQLVARLSTGEVINRRMTLKTGDVELNTYQPERLQSASLADDILSTYHGPTYRLLIVGAGDMANFVAGTAVQLGFDVTICDPRHEVRKYEHHSSVKFTTEMPDDVVIDMQPDSRTAVVTLSHDPKLDDLALMEALKTSAFYIGAIGSRKSDAARRERLKLFDVTSAQLSNLRGPVGLHIGAKTPIEIGVSIVAELVAALRGADIEGAPKTVAAGKC